MYGMEDARQSFERLLVKYREAIGPEYADMMRQDIEAGEALNAFENFVNSLRESEVEVDLDSKAKIGAIAQALDCLDSSSGKGVYW